MLRAVTDEIMYELMKLSSQEYVDEYAQRAKGRLASALRHDGRGRGSPDNDAQDDDAEDDDAHDDDARAQDGRLTQDSRVAKDAAVDGS